MAPRTRQVTHGESPTGFSQAPPPPPPPPPLKRRFHYRAAFFFLLPLHSSPSENAKPLQKINKISIGSEKPPHTLFSRFKENSLVWRFPISPPPPPHTGTHPTLKVHVVSIDPDVPHQTELGPQRNYLYRISSFDGHSISSNLSLPTTIPPPKKRYAISTAPHPLPTSQNKSRRHINPVISN